MANKVPNQDNLKPKTISYIFDEDLAKETCRIPNIGNRSFMTHELIKAYKLISYMECLSSKLASNDDLLTFHSQQYVDYLCSGRCTKSENSQNVRFKLSAHQVVNLSHNSSGDGDSLNLLHNNSDEYEELVSEEDGDEEYGLGYDCPKFFSMDQFARKVTGGTLTAVESLLNGSDISINWCGGWHHAQRDSASGFCYVNDIVIGIQALQKKFKKVLYLDIDAHHGDGVDNAFSWSKNIMTVSLHNFENGFFPGSGDYNDVGFGKGKYYSVNVPLKNGINDRQFIYVFDRILKLVEEKFTADAIVMQCGMDGLSKDPLGTFNLTLNSYGHCVNQVLKQNVPILFLGGGGYNAANSARGWAYLTSVILSKRINSEIPEHKYFPLYGSDFELEIHQGLRKNENDETYLQEVISKIQGNLENI